MRKAGKNLAVLEESLLFKKFHDDDYNDDKKLSSIKRLFELLKPKKTDDNFGGRRNNYIEYISR